MRRTLLAILVVMTCYEGAFAGSSVPIDIFDDVFAQRAAALHPDLKPSGGICDDARHCMIAAAPGVVLLVNAPAATEGVDGATVVAPYDGRAASTAFAGTCDALIALLSGGLSDADRKAALARLLDGARRDGSAELATGGISYRTELRDDHRIVLTAKSPG